MHRALAAAVLSACTAGTPSWYGQEPRVVRDIADDWFVIATGRGDADNRQDACDAARDDAQRGLREAFFARYADRAQIVEAVGGPSRIVPVLDAFITEASRTAQLTGREYDDARRRCYVELSWLLPHRLPEAIRRNLEAPPEEEVALELRRALAPQATSPVKKRSRGLGRASPLAAVQALYPGWFVRLLDDCVAFVGAPGDDEARWVTLRREDDGWYVASDAPAVSTGWPEPPGCPEQR